MSGVIESHRLIIMDLNEMTHEQKVTYMRLACNIAGISFNHANTDLLVTLYDLVIKHEGEVDLEMVTKAVREVQTRADIRDKGEMLGKAIKNA